MELDRCPSAISLNAFSPHMLFFASENDVSVIMHKENERKFKCLVDTRGVQFQLLGRGI
jgi:hypothetical protein